MTIYLPRSYVDAIGSGPYLAIEYHTITLHYVVLILYLFLPVNDPFHSLVTPVPKDRPVTRALTLIFLHNVTLET